MITLAFPEWAWPRCPLGSALLVLVVVALDVVKLLTGCVDWFTSAIPVLVNAAVWLVLGTPVVFGAPVLDVTVMLPAFVVGMVPFVGVGVTGPVVSCDGVAPVLRVEFPVVISVVTLVEPLARSVIGTLEVV